MRTTVATKQDIIERLRQHQDRIQALGVKKLGLFGSWVHQEQDEASDIDLLVEFKPEEKTFDNFIKLSFLLEEVLQRRVELITMESLSPYIGPHILEEAEYVSFSH